MGKINFECKLLPNLNFKLFGWVLPEIQVFLEKYENISIYVNKIHEFFKVKSINGSIFLYLSIVFVSFGSLYEVVYSELKYSELKPLSTWHVEHILIYCGKFYLWTWGLSTTTAPQHWCYQNKTSSTPLRGKEIWRVSWQFF